MKINKSQYEKINEILEILSSLKKKKFFVFLHEPSINSNDIKNVTNALKESEISTYGKYTKIFENKIKKYTKSRHVICTINGTAALHISLILSGVKKNHEVMLSTLGFISSVNVISYLNATPHFVDCEENSLGVDPIKLEEYLKKNTYIVKNECTNKKTKKIIKAIIVTHVFGNPSQIIKIKKIAKKFCLKLIEDSAEALGSWYYNKHLGTFGDFGVLSFNGNKIITTGGGGAILTKNLDDAKKSLKLIKNMKMDKKFDQVFDGVGYNYRLPSLNSALGCSQINKLKFFLEKKKLLHKFYKQKFAKLKFCKINTPIKGSQSNNWLQAIILNEGEESLRNKILELTNKNKIQTRPVWSLLHKMKLYKNCPKMDLRNAIKIEKRIVNIPSSPNLL